MNVTAVTIIVIVVTIVVTVYFEKETYTSFRKCLDKSQYNTRGGIAEIIDKQGE
jgi:uncharacterized membrane protein